MLKAGGPAVFSRESEGVNIVFVEISPVLESNAKLECPVYLCNELFLFDLEQLVQDQQRRNSRLANTNGRYLVGLDQFDIEILAD